MKNLLLPLILLVCIVPAKAQQKPTLVKDMNISSNSSNPDHLLVVDDILYFAADNGVNGLELWKSDGTVNGTEMVKDITVGIGNSSPRNFVAFYDKLLFNANSNELWISDGTENGTKKVADKAVTTGGAIANGFYFFSAYTSSTGYELWRTDGTDAGTFMITETNSGSASGNPSYLTAMGDTVYFAATGLAGRELWMSDGSVKGTQLVKDIYSGTSSSSPTDLVNYNGNLYFRANDGINGSELWKSDGTSLGTVMFADIIPGSRSGYPNYIVNSGKWLYFAATDTANGREIWKSDGTLNGTVMVKDLDPWGSSNPESLVGTNDKVFFIANVDNGKELYFSDGTAANTRMTRDLYPIQTDAQIRHMTAVGDTLFFVAHSAPNYQDFELYMSTGTSSSTRIVKDIIGGGTASNPYNLIAYEGKCFFVVNDRVKGTELWVSDGSLSGTTLFKDVYDGTEGSAITNVASFDNGVVFTPYTQLYGRELWITNGNSQNTQLVKDIASGTSSTSPEWLTPSGDRMYFYVYPGRGYGELYYTDGTDNGTAYNRLTSYSDYLSELVALNDDTLIFARRSSFNEEIWSYARGGSSRQIRKINPNGLGADVASLVKVGRYVYFTADDGNTSGRELWRTDGTYSGTVRVKDIRSGFSDSNPSALTPSGKKLYFTADDGSKGRELWVTDGTESNTLIVKEFNTSGSTVIGAMIGDGNGNLYFTVDDGQHGQELWMTDGTETGTKLVKDIMVGTGSSSISFLASAAGITWFTADDGQSGLELWNTDGTESGTKLVKDINSGLGSGNITNFLVVRDQVYFSATDGKSGNELWKSDGTSKGTKMVYDMISGSEGSNPKMLTLHKDTLYFVANSIEYGEELFYIFTNCLAPDFSGLSSCPGDSAIFSNHSDSLGQDSVTYIWNVDGSLAATGRELEYPFDSAGSYTVTLVMVRPGCRAEITKQHVVNSPPSPGFISDNDSVCFQGHSFTFTSTTLDPDNNLTYQWNFSDGTKANQKATKKSFIKAGRYTVALTAANEGCEASVEQKVRVYPMPVVSGINGKSETTTKVDTFTVQDNPGSTYTWSVNNGTQTGGGNTNEVIVEWDTTFNRGRIDVIETNSYGCQSSEVSKRVDLDFTNSIGGLSSLSINIYPNPSNGQFFIEMPENSEGLNLQVFNSVGTLVYSRTGFAVSAEPFSIQLDDFSEGVYLLKLVSDESSYTANLVVRP